MEKKIIRRLKKGDEQAFDQIFEEYYYPLCIYSLQIVQSTEIAEDIVQDVFVEVWEKRYKIDPARSFKAYLYTIAKNKCLDHIKHRNIKDVYLKEQVNQGISTDQKMEFDRIEYLYNAIDSLPPKCKEVFILSRFENYKYAEIAKELNISVKTVENHMGKALKHLRDCLKEDK